MKSIFGQPYKLVLTDGQQRITTTMLFLVAVRDVVENEDFKRLIDSKYLRNENVSDSTEYKIKLKQVETDWEAYRRIILKSDLTDENKNSAVYRNYSYFVRELKAIQKENEISIQDFISCGLDKFSIVTIQLEPERNSWENPQEIFESMNSLGKPLSLADLVRNYLLLGKKANEQDELYKNYWLHIEKQIPEQVSNFIRDYMQLKAGKSFKKATPTNYKELYAEFKLLFRENDVENLISDLKKYSNFYSNIVLGKPSGSVEIDRKLRDLRTIDVTIIYSFLLFLLENWKADVLSEQELCDILDVLIIYFVRRRILKLKGENQNFPALVNELDSVIYGWDKKSAIFEVLANQDNATRLPNDVEVASELKVMNFYNFNLAKFILSLVEEKITKSRPDKDDKKLQIEHIMPNTLNDIWKGELGEDFENIHREFINTIGNLTLIRHNQELGNKSFEAKKEVYINNSGLQIARTEITNRSKWNKNSIQNRSKWIVDYILENVLPIPTEMRNRNNFKQKEGRRLSFLGLQLIGEEIQYISDKSITAKVTGDKEVEFEGETYKLSPLTCKIEERKGTVNASRSYQGAQYWEYDGIKLVDIM